jgi:hypothetical protein
MKLVSNTGGRVVFQLAQNEHETVLRLLGMHTHLPLDGRQLSKDETDDRKLESAQEDLQLAFEDHRRELYLAVEALLRDPAQCVPTAKGFKLSLEHSHVEMMLQAVNGIRVGAWEKMGAPDFESGDKPEMTPLTEACVSIIQVTDLLLAQLLRGLEPKP